METQHIGMQLNDVFVPHRDNTGTGFRVQRATTEKGTLADGKSAGFFAGLLRIESSRTEFGSS